MNPTNNGDSVQLNIKVPTLMRVEGEGGLDIRIDADAITELKFHIFEPPRLFEKLLEGREYQEVPDITARICGICPVAYQMSAAHAIEAAFGTRTSPWINKMRRVLYCGEWIQSHALHIHLLALPDFLGYENSIAMAADYGIQLKRGLALQKLGNDIIATFGARSVHPVGPTVGGFYHAPDTSVIKALLDKFPAAIQDAEDLIRWIASLDIPSESQDFISVALTHPEDYPLNEGQITSSTGLQFSPDEFDQYITEYQVPWSTALHASLQGQPYLVGPLARLNLNADKLPASIQALMKELDLQFPSQNMFDSLIARAIEILYALLEAQRLLENYTPDPSPRETITTRAATGSACTEAPRGILFHRYEMDENGLVRAATIVPPTSQNQSRIEADLKHSLEALGLQQDDDVLRHHAETVVRNYDPCISCSVHFLTLKVDRGQ